MFSEFVIIIIVTAVEEVVHDYQNEHNNVWEKFQTTGTKQAFSFFTGLHPLNLKKPDVCIIPDWRVHVA